MHTFDFEDLLSQDLNILAYGAPGVGKTMFAGSVGELLYTYYADIDKGSKTLLQLPRAWRNNLQPVAFDNFKDLDKAYKLLKRNDPQELSRALSTPTRQVVIPRPFQAVAFDTWSEMNWEIVQELRDNVGKGGNDSLVFRKNIEIQDWNAIQDLNRMAMEAFRELPITFICTLHEIMTQDDVTKVVRGLPSVNGKFAAEIGKHFDIMGHMSVNIAGKYVMDTKTKATFQAKSRLKLDAVIENPTYKRIVENLKANAQ